MSPPILKSSLDQLKEALGDYEFDGEVIIHKDVESDYDEYSDDEEEDNDVSVESVGSVEEEEELHISATPPHGGRGYSYTIGGAPMPDQISRHERSESTIVHPDIVITVDKVSSLKLASPSKSPARGGNERSAKFKEAISSEYKKMLDDPNSFRAEKLKQRKSKFFTKEGTQMKSKFYKQYIEEKLTAIHENVEKYKADLIKNYSEELSTTLDTEGLFRVAGNQSEVETLMKSLLQLGFDIPTDCCVHVVSSTLKKFLRQLSVPIFTFKYHHEFLKTLKLDNDQVKTEGIRKTLSQLPEYNQQLIRHLMKFLVEVTKHSKSNMMHAHNLGLMFGPIGITAAFAAFLVYINQEETDSNSSSSGGSSDDGSDESSSEYSSSNSHELSSGDDSDEAESFPLLEELDVVEIILENMNYILSLATTSPKQDTFLINDRVEARADFALLCLQNLSLAEEGGTEIIISHGINSLIKLLNSRSPNNLKKQALYTILNMALSPRAKRPFNFDKTSESCVGSIAASTQEQSQAPTVVALHKKKVFVDPFSPCDKDLFVCDLFGTHNLVLNKFNVSTYHSIIATTDFQDQTERLNQKDFRAIWECVKSCNMLCFFNCGPNSGASQPHKHVQLLRTPYFDNGPACPMDSLMQRYLGKPDQIVDLASLGFENAAISLDKSKIGTLDELALSVYFENNYLQLLQHLGIYERLNSTPPPSYNFIMTQDWMFVIPRRCYQSRGISINSVGFTGAILVKKEEELDTLKQHGIMNILRDVSFERPTITASRLINTSPL
eukprot:gene17682-21081_t